MSTQLADAVARNRRRQNRDMLRRKLSGIGLHGLVSSEKDVHFLRTIRSEPPIEREYLQGWANVMPKLTTLPLAPSEALLLAPYNYEENGTARVDGQSALEALSKKPLEFDLDGFWIVGDFGGVLVDFDDDHLGADILWKRFAPRSRV